METRRLRTTQIQTGTILGIRKVLIRERTIRR